MGKIFRSVVAFIAMAVIVFTFNYGGTAFSKAYSKVMKYVYPKKYTEYVEKYSNEYNVDPLLVYAVIKAESNFDDSVVSGSDAKGLMQLMDSTAEDVAKDFMGDENFDSNVLFDAETNIHIGVSYLSELLQKYNGNYYVAVAAYNAGIGTVSNWIDSGVIKADGSDIENIPYKETNNYVRKISRAYQMYQELY